MIRRIPALAAFAVTVLVLGLVTGASAADSGTARQQGDEAYLRGDFPAAAEAYRSAASAGDPIAQTRLGWFYRNGTGVAQDFNEALHLFAAAARQGHPGGEFSLGTMYEHGRGIAQDLTLAARWYQAAAVQGNAGAQNNLGWLYQNGQGVARDYAEAARWYRMAADQGQPDAQGNLGLLYLDGKGVPRDLAEAERLLRRAASQGDQGAQAQVSKLLRERTVSAAATQRGGSDMGTGQVFGQWRSKEPIRDEGLRRMYLILEIKPAAVTFRYDCRFLDGSILVGSFVSRAEVTPGAIRILEGGTSRAASAENQCVASIQPTTLPYRQSGEELTVTFGGKAVAMTRG